MAKSYQVRVSAALFIASGLLAASREVTYQGDLAPLNIRPTLDHGYLIVWDRNVDDDISLKRISVYAPDGLLAFQTIIHVPGQQHPSLINGAADTDGSVAVVFRGPGGFALLDKTGQQERTVLTGSYAPTQICFAPDHTIWLAGAATGADYGIFRRYSKDGNQLGEFVPKSNYDLSPGRGMGSRAMRAAGDRIVALLERPSNSPSPPTLEWIELDLGGNVIGRLGTHRFFFPWALTPDGTIYANEGAKFLVFDRATRSWKPAIVPAPAGGVLMDADENGLIYLVNPATFKWAPTK